MFADVFADADVLVIIGNLRTSAARTVFFGACAPRPLWDDGVRLVERFWRRVRSYDDAADTQEMAAADGIAATCEERIGFGGMAWNMRGFSTRRPTLQTVR